MTEFEDIRITAMTWHAALKVSPESPAFEIQFKISASAPERWRDIFEVEWVNTENSFELYRLA